MINVSFEGCGKFSYHYPALAIIVTSHSNGNDNAMAAAWHAPISMSPPLYGVSIALQRYTHQLIIDSGEFGINFIPLDSAEIIAAVGGSKGSSLDKFERFNIQKQKSLVTSVPIIKSAYAAYECRLFDRKTFGDHEWFVGEIVASHIDKKTFTENGILDTGEVQPALYLGGENYLTLARTPIHHLERKIFGKI